MRLSKGGGTGGWGEGGGGVGVATGAITVIFQDGAENGIEFARGVEIHAL